jgi:hypothetical protein
LEQLKIYPMKTMALEEKPDRNIEWTAYDPESMLIKVSIWRKDMVTKFKSLINYSEQQSHKLRVNRNTSLTQFKEVLCSQFNLAHPVAMRRTPML